MSLNFLIYRANNELGPINTWSTNHAEPIADVSLIKHKLEILFPYVKWDLENDEWSGLGTSPDEKVYIDISFINIDGEICFICLRKGLPSTMRQIMELFELNFVSCPEAECLVDPYKYDDEDHYFVEKPWHRS